MLEVLETTLGLTPLGPGAVDSTVQGLVGIQESLKCFHRTQLDKISHEQDCFGIIAKCGHKNFRVWSWLSNSAVLFLALASAAISILVVVGGCSMDWETIESYAWGTGSITIFNTTLQDELFASGSIKKKISTYEFNVGLLRMANLGGGEAPQRSSWRMSQVVQLQKYSTLETCSTQNDLHLEQQLQLENIPNHPTSNGTAFQQVCHMIPGLLQPSTAAYATVDCNYQGGRVALLLHTEQSCGSTPYSVLQNLTLGCTSLQHLGSLGFIRTACTTQNSTLSFPATETNGWFVWQNIFFTRLKVLPSNGGAPYGNVIVSNGRGVLLVGASQCKSYLCVGWAPGIELNNQNADNHTWQLHIRTHASKSCNSVVVATLIVNASVESVSLQSGLNHAASHPFLLKEVNGDEVQVFCPAAEYANVSRLAKVSYEVAERACVIDLSHCKEKSENKYQSCTVDTSMVDYCTDCYEIGVAVFIVMVVTMCVQVPLLWLSIVRANAFKDSRCAKFWSLPISGVITVLSVAVVLLWVQNCSEPFTSTVLQNIALTQIAGKLEVLETYGQIDWGVNYAAFLPLVSAACTGLICMFNMLTPVPEMYNEQWIDPLFAQHENSLLPFEMEKENESVILLGESECYGFSHFQQVFSNNEKQDSASTPAVALARRCC